MCENMNAIARKINTFDGAESDEEFQTNCKKRKNIEREIDEEYVPSLKRVYLKKRVKWKNVTSFKKSYKRCIHPSCDTYASFGFEGNRAQFCNKHKQEGMRSVLKKKCEYETCDKQPCFGFKGGRVRFCKFHKQEEMVNVKNRKCQHEGCVRQPSFGFKGARKQFCNEHKQEGMINVVGKRCEFVGCDKLAYYYVFKERNIAHFCREHKQEEMVHVKKIQKM